MEGVTYPPFSRATTGVKPTGMVRISEQAKSEKVCFRSVFVDWLLKNIYCKKNYCCFMGPIWLTYYQVGKYVKQVVCGEPAVLKGVYKNCLLRLFSHYILCPKGTVEKWKNIKAFTLRINYWFPLLCYIDWARGLTMSWLWNSDFASLLSSALMRLQKQYQG